MGAERLDPVQGFNENSIRSQEVRFAYGKLRAAELERNVWAFATRRAIIRPIDSNTMMLSPTLWSSFITYFVGSIVADQFDNLWISNIPNNTNNDPLSTTFWEPYFGPMTASLYDSSVNYFAGEVVYTLAGDGTYNTWLSLQNANAVHPALPNLWTATTIYQQNDVVVVWPAWSSVTTYTQGQTVQYTDGLIYASITNGNLNNIPPSSPTQWALVPTLTLSSQPVPIQHVVMLPTSSPVSEWSQGQLYNLGNVVIFNNTQWVSIANNNVGNFPNAAGSTSWAQLTGGTYSMSLINLNLGNNPANSPAAWNGGTSYSIGNLVGGSDGAIYQSLVNGNLGNDPTLDLGTNWQNNNTLVPWTTVFSQGRGNPLWTQIGGAAFPFGVGLESPTFVYPLFSGPTTFDNTRNAFRLPNGFLKPTSSDPKAGSVSFLGAPTALQYKDWLYEGKFIVSRETSPIVLRFVADITDVTQMSSMFCEGLGCRIAIEVCEKLTQSTAKVELMSKMYDRFMFEARLTNAIEIGSEEQPEDDFVSCRR